MEVGAELGHDYPGQLGLSVHWSWAGWGKALCGWGIWRKSVPRTGRVCPVGGRECCHHSL